MELSAAILSDLADELAKTFAVPAGAKGSSALEIDESDQRDVEALLHSNEDLRVIRYAHGVAFLSVAQVLTELPKYLRIVCHRPHESQALIDGVLNYFGFVKYWLIVRALARSASAIDSAMLQSIRRGKEDARSKRGIAKQLMGRELSEKLLTACLSNLPYLVSRDSPSIDVFLRWLRSQRHFGSQTSSALS
jgi:hypothetical protein